LKILRVRSGDHRIVDILFLRLLVLVGVLILEPTLPIIIVGVLVRAFGVGLPYLDFVTLPQVAALPNPDLGVIFVAGKYGGRAKPADVLLVSHATVRP
jgi:hypothetical protein